MIGILKSTNYVVCVTLILLSTASCSRVQFRAILGKKDVIRVDENLQFTVLLKNKGFTKRYVNLPAINEDLFIYLKDSMEDYWHQIDFSRLNGSMGKIELQPQKPLVFECNFGTNLMLYPNRTYILGAAYFPRGNYHNYDPNSPRKKLFPAFKYSEFSIKTSELSEKESFEWNWINEHGLMRDYIWSGHRIIDREMFRIAETFLKEFPESIFNEKVKILYIRHVMTMMRGDSGALPYIDQAILFTLDVEKSNPIEVGGDQKRLLEMKEKLKQ